jgi:hypothetical protein
VYLVIAMVKDKRIGALRFVVLVLYGPDAEGLKVADLCGHAVVLQVSVEGGLVEEQ